MVPQEIYSGLMAKENQTYPPLVGHLANLDQELNAIMANPNISTDTKYQLYQQVFSRYQHLKNQQFPNLISSQNIGPELKVPMGTQTDYQIDENSLIASLPKTVRRKGKILVDHLMKRQGDFKWTPDGQLIDMESGKAIPESNIVDLVHYVTRNRPARVPPAGSEDFMERLAKTNVPREAIGNTQSDEENFMTPTTSRGLTPKTPIVGTKFSPGKTPKSNKSDSVGKKIGVPARRYNKLSPVSTPKPRIRNPPARYGQFIEQR